MRAVKKVILFLWFVLLGLIHAFAIVSPTAENDIGVYVCAGCGATNRVNVAYDCLNSLANLGSVYDVAATLEKKRPAQGYCTLLGRFSQFLAAETRDPTSSASAKAV